MNRLEILFLHLSTVLVAGTGLVYAWMRYFAKPPDPFAVVNHPLQPTVQHLHVWFAPALVFGAGLLWRHVWLQWQSAVRNGRRSGVAMLAALLPMVVSGYFIQTTITETWRDIWVWVHLITAVLWLLGYAGHVVAQVRQRDRLNGGLRGTAAISPTRFPSGSDDATEDEPSEAQEELRASGHGG
jgi:hypothetical protein